MAYNHPTHILRDRQDFKEWCGGTEPPTIATVRPMLGMMDVQVFPAGTNLHVGEIHQPARVEEFMIAPEREYGPTEVGEYALRAAKLNNS